MGAGASKPTDAGTQTAEQTKETQTADERATLLAQKVLAALRPAQKDSCTVAEKVEIFVHQWATDAEVKSSALSSEQQAQRKQFRRNKHTNEAMALFANSDAAERQTLKEMITMLCSKAGRADLMNRAGAQHEAAASAEICEECVHETTVEECIPSRGTPVTFQKLTAAECSSLNGTSGVIRGYASCVDRYIVQCHDGSKVRVRRGNICMSAATMDDVVATYGAMDAQNDVSLLHSRHGHQSTCALIKELLALPNRAWTIADDLWLIAE
eukprot:5775675-Prymnesium_polylepis.1